MNTLRAETDTAYERLRSDMALLREDIAKRETRLILAVGGMIATGVVVLGFLMRWSTIV